jgi:hypothetical protein
VAWTLKRVAISVFVVAHLAMVTLWTLPGCPIQARCVRYVAHYLMPLGQWQYWGMFSPDPVRDSITLEAVVLDAKGLLHTFAFPTEQERSWWQASLHYRHSKFVCNYSYKDEFKAHREFGARHAVRQLKLPADAFPVEVQLMFRVRPTPPPGGPLPDPMAPITPVSIDTYRFPTPQEVLP